MIATCKAVRALDCLQVFLASLPDFPTEHMIDFDRIRSAVIARYNKCATQKEDNPFFSVDILALCT